MPDVSWNASPVAWYDGTVRVVEIASQTAVWYHSGKPPVPIRWVLVRDPKGEFDPQALLCTDPAVAPVQILEWFVLRWQLEVTFQEVRSHLGVETQRQWSDRAIARTTPVLMGLFSWITLASHLLQKQQPIIQRTAAWYAKPAPTFVDAIALLRRTLWLASEGFSMSPSHPNSEKVPTAFYARLIDRPESSDHQCFRVTGARPVGVAESVFSCFLHKSQGSYSALIEHGCIQSNGANIL